MIESTDKNLSLLFTLLMGPISIILLVISVYLIQPKVEAKLASSVRLELSKHNIKAEVSFSGRDGILKGEVETQEIVDNAEKISLAVFGTRVIRNYLNVRTKQDDFAQAPIIKKISYSTNQPKKERNLKTNLASMQRTKGKVVTVQNKPIFISDVDKIMANMQQLKKPIVQNRVANIKKPIKVNYPIIESEHKRSHPVKNISIPQKKKFVFNGSNELLNIINTFNSSLDNDLDRQVLSEDKKRQSNTSFIYTQKLEGIDLSTLHFPDGSTVLPQEAHPVLDKISEVIKAQSLSYIELIAYAKDSDIGYARGVTIREYLATKGIQKSIFHISGHTLLDTKSKKIAFEIITLK